MCRSENGGDAGVGADGGRGVEQRDDAMRGHDGRGAGLSGTAGDGGGHPAAAEGAAGGGGGRGGMRTEVEDAPEDSDDELEVTGGWNQGGAGWNPADSWVLDEVSLDDIPEGSAQERTVAENMRAQQIKFDKYMPRHHVTQKIKRRMWALSRLVPPKLRELESAKAECALLSNELKVKKALVKARRRDAEEQKEWDMWMVALNTELDTDFDAERELVGLAAGSEIFRQAEEHNAAVAAVRRVKFALGGEFDSESLVGDLGVVVKLRGALQQFQPVALHQMYIRQKTQAPTAKQSADGPEAADAGHGPSVDGEEDNLADGLAQGEHPDAVRAAAQAATQEAAQAAALAEAAAQVEAAAQAEQERKLQNYIALKADYDTLATEYQHLYFHLIQNEEWPNLRELICLELSADQRGTCPDTVYLDLHVEPNDYYGKIVAQLRSKSSLLLCQAKVALINGILQAKSGLITEARDRAIGSGFIPDVFVTGFQDFHQTLELFETVYSWNDGARSPYLAEDSCIIIPRKVEDHGVYMFQMVLRLFQGASELPLPFFQHLTGTVPVLADFTLTHADYDVREVHEDIFPANAAWLWKWEAWSNEGKVTRLLEKAEGRAGVKIPRWCIYSNLFGRYKVNGAALNRGWLRAFDACPGQTNASIVENLGALRKKIIDGAGLTAVVKRFTTLVDLAAQDFIDNMVLVYKVAYPNSPTLRMFMEVVKTRLPPWEIRLLYKFVTGRRGVNVFELTGGKMRIEVMEPHGYDGKGNYLTPQNLPVGHTYDVSMSLPDYRDIEVLHKKLKRAIVECGFGIA